MLAVWNFNSFVMKILGPSIAYVLTKNALCYKITVSAIRLVFHGHAINVFVVKKFDKY